MNMTQAFLPSWWNNITKNIYMKQISHTSCWKNITLCQNNKTVWRPECSPTWKLRCVKRRTMTWPGLWTCRRTFSTAAKPENEEVSKRTPLKLANNFRSTCREKQREVINCWGIIFSSGKSQQSKVRRKNLIDEASYLVLEDRKQSKIRQERERENSNSRILFYKRERARENSNSRTLFYKRERERALLPS